MEICRNGLDSDLSDNYPCFFLNRTVSERITYSFKNSGTYIDSGSVNGVHHNAKSSKINGKVVI